MIGSTKKRKEMFNQPANTSNQIVKRNKKKSLMI